VSEFGIDYREHVRVLDWWAAIPWIGDRLSTMLAVGPTTSAHAGRLPPDGRTLPHRPFERNLPVLLGLLTVWYTDFFGAETVAVLPYEQYLKRFPLPAELTMESNGKHVTPRAPRSATPAGPIYWGEAGQNGQHPSIS